MFQVVDNTGGLFWVWERTRLVSGPDPPGFLFGHLGLDLSLLNGKGTGIGLYLTVCSVMSDSCDPMDCGPPGSSVHGILQARILEWVAISYSRGSSWPRDGSCISCVSYIGRRILYHCSTWEAPIPLLILANLNIMPGFKKKKNVLAPQYCWSLLDADFWAMLYCPHAICPRRT